MTDKKPEVHSTATIGRSIHVDGHVRGEEDLVIEGTVEGTITVQDANIIVAETGVVKADVIAKIIVVEGEVRGELRGSESVEIKPNGTVHGDIRAPRVMLGDGCQFKGTVDMDHKDIGGAGDRALAGKPGRRPVPKPNGPRPILGGPRPSAPARKLPLGAATAEETKENALKESAFKEGESQ